MSRSARLLFAVVAAVALPSGTVQAMEIRQFDKISTQDQSDYVGDLIISAENVLADEGRPNLTAQVKHLLTTKDPGDADVIGIVEFERNLALARVAVAQRALKDPNAHRLYVEDAMLVTLEQNSIPVSQDFIRDFRALNSDFKPKSALVTQNLDGSFTIQKEPSKDAPIINGLVIPTSPRF